MPLSLARVGHVAILALALGGLLVLELLAQSVEIEVAQCIGAQTAGLEVLVLPHVGRVREQIRDLGPDGVVDAIGMQALEQQQRLEVGVGGEARIHPPSVCGARAMGRGRNGSQRDGRRRSSGASGHRMRRAR